jgi:uncharacterized membrane protein
MDRTSNARVACAICGRTAPPREMIPAALVRDTLLPEIRRRASGWSTESAICQRDLNDVRASYVRSLLQEEKGELTVLENAVLGSLEQHAVLSANVDETFEKQWTIGERLADRLASFGGSWSFLALFAGFLVLWIAVNSWLLLRAPFDPYPFILLNLILSCLAAVQAPIIMMSQNRQEAKDRARAQHDYQVNLKAELEIRHLHEKIDHMLSQQWQRLVEIQQVQLELLAEIGGRR